MTSARRWPTSTSAIPGCRSPKWPFSSAMPRRARLRVRSKSGRGRAREPLLGKRAPERDIEGDAHAEAERGAEGGPEEVLVGGRAEAGLVERLLERAEHHAEAGAAHQAHPAVVYGRAEGVAAAAETRACRKVKS